MKPLFSNHSHVIYINEVLMSRLTSPVSHLEGEMFGLIRYLCKSFIDQVCKVGAFISH